MPSDYTRDLTDGTTLQLTGQQARDITQLLYRWLARMQPVIDERFGKNTCAALLTIYNLEDFEADLLARFPAFKEPNS